ncbi:OmpA family protein [Variovorax rhizosphaerae]|uniref:OmpA family protein n=1 Tax=Variovorax rhizosphaerae TaxID=1836200 RepID=A0ABU8WSQ2_9BURK
MKSIVSAASHPIAGFVFVFLLVGIQPISADTQHEGSGVEPSLQAAQMLIVRDYAGYDEISLPLDPRSESRGVRSPLFEEPPQPRPPTPAILSVPELSSSLDANGKVVVAGIRFDARNELDPSSKPALDQIGALLKQRPALRLHVVVHTDNIGALASNRELSQRYAHAICVALVVDYGIARNRLTANGLGSLSPLVSNQSGRGRATNRRVELVVQ